MPISAGQRRQIVSGGSASYIRKLKPHKHAIPRNPWDPKPARLQHQRQRPARPPGAAASRGRRPPPAPPAQPATPRWHRRGPTLTLALTLTLACRRPRFRPGSARRRSHERQRGAQVRRDRGAHRRARIAHQREQRPGTRHHHIKRCLQTHQVMHAIDSLSRSMLAFFYMPFTGSTMEVTTFLGASQTRWRAY